jgi:MoaA/NifB/PqqE/SkfB family radical SAM enzyme
MAEVLEQEPGFYQGDPATMLAEYFIAHRSDRAFILSPELAQSEEIASSTMPSVDWWITSRCNLACDFCYGPEPTKDDIALREDIARRLAESPAETITFCGGEPLILGEEIFKYARMFKDAGKRVVLNTNGELLERMIERFLKPGEDLPFDVVGLSIEAPTQEEHALMRSGFNPAGSFRAGNLAATFRAAHIVKAYGKSLKVATVVSKVNKDWLPRLAQFIRYEIDPDVWRLYQYSPFGDYNRGQERHTLPLEEFQDAVYGAAGIAYNMPTYPSDNESQNCLIVDPAGQLSLSTRIGYQKLGDCLAEPIGDIWERELEIVQSQVMQNKRWIGATALNGALYPYYDPRINWWKWLTPSGTEGVVRHLNAVSDLKAMRQLVTTHPEKFKKVCINSIPKDLPYLYKEVYWMEARKQLMGCDTNDPVATMKAANRFMHYAHQCVDMAQA